MAVPGHPDRVGGQGTERDLDHPRPTPGDDARDSETGSETMSNRAQVDWQDQDGASERELEELPVLSRRTLFGATGGFALAASGLLLPDWLVEEAEAADKHPVRGVQQRKEQRRKKQRNERDRRRKAHRRRDDSTKPPGLGPKGIRLIVVNETDRSFSPCSHWAGTIGWYRNKWEDLNKRGSTGSSFTEDTEELHAGVLVDTLHVPFVWVENPLAGTPNTTYHYGGSMTPFGYRGGTMVVDHGTLEEGAETTHRIPFTDSSTFAIRVRRETDIAGFKVFKITVLPA